jgi:hypothetical protein
MREGIPEVQIERGKDSRKRACLIDDILSQDTIKALTHKS